MATVNLGDAAGIWKWDNVKGWIPDPVNKGKKYNRMKPGQDKGEEKRRKEEAERRKKFHQRIDKEIKELPLQRKEP
jgi:hypothetical protein